MVDWTTDTGANAALTWSFTAVASILTCGRFWLRWRTVRRSGLDDSSNSFRLDDLFNGIALICVVAESIMDTLWAEDNAIENDPTAMLKSQLAIDLLMWTTLYSVKASFLALLHFIFIGRLSTIFRKVWWALTIYTALTFAIIFLSEFWQCGDPLNYANPSACSDTFVNDSFSSNEYWIAPLWFKAFFHISSDCFILALPLACIRKLNMPMVKKIGAGATFAVVVIDIVVGILRNLTIIQIDLYGGNSGFYSDASIVCGYIEPTLAVIVCTMPEYRKLLSSSQQRKIHPQEFQGNAARISNPRPRVRAPDELPSITSDEGVPESADGDQFEGQVWADGSNKTRHSGGGKRA